MIIDAHSKWLVIHITNSCNGQTTIDNLRMTFASQGLPKMVVSNNGPAFVSNEFEESMRKNGIRHVKAVPYHPALNGLVERAVQTFKTAMKKQDGSMQIRLSRFLFKYQITPHTTTDQSPAQLRWGTQLRSHLTLLHPEVGTRPTFETTHSFYWGGCSGTRICQLQTIVDFWESDRENRPDFIENSAES